ncbi:MAG: hypothetical protein PVF58_17090 [Candidatus Methanofastidiosia archaeon]|jgi:hypothetical protein
MKKITGKGIIALIIAVLIAIGIFTVFYHFLPPDQCYTTGQMMDPFGTGNQLITVYVKIYRDHTCAEKALETEEGELIAYSRYNRDGYQISGFKFDKGVYYEWVLNTSDDPSQSGQWQKREPPAELNIDRIQIYCHTRYVILWGTSFGLTILIIVNGIMKRKVYQKNGNE